MEIPAELLKWGAYVITAVLGWFLREIKGDVNKLKTDQSAFALHLSETYVKKDEYKEQNAELKESVKETIQPIFKKLDKLEELLITHLATKRDERRE